VPGVPVDLNHPALQGEDIDLDGAWDPNTETDPTSLTGPDSDDDGLADGLEWGAHDPNACLFLGPIRTPSHLIGSSTPTRTPGPIRGRRTQTRWRDGRIRRLQRRGSGRGRPVGLRPNAFRCGTTYTLDTLNESNPNVGGDDRGSKFQRGADPNCPDRFAGPGNATVVTYLQNQDPNRIDLAVMVCDRDENQDPNQREAIWLSRTDSCRSQPSTLDAGLVLPEG